MRQTSLNVQLSGFGHEDVRHLFVTKAQDARKGAVCDGVSSMTRSFSIACAGANRRRIEA
jgi:hypothetical protein